MSKKKLLYISTYKKFKNSCIKFKKKKKSKDTNLTLFNFYFSKFDV